MEITEIIESLSDQMENVKANYRSRVRSINELMDRIEEIQREAEDLATLHCRLYEAATALGEQAGVEVVFTALDQDPIADPPPQFVEPLAPARPAPVVPPVSGNRVVRYTRFRDWVVKFSDREAGFTKADVQEALQTKTVDYMIKMGLEKHLIEKIGTVDTGKRGRQPYLYRHLKKAPEGPGVQKISSKREVSDPVPTSVRLPKDIHQIVAPALRDGAAVGRTGSGHWRLTQKGKRPVIVASTPSDNRWRKNLKAELRRNRYKVS